jgi:hypothetical protein
MEETLCWVALWHSLFNRLVGYPTPSARREMGLNHLIPQWAEPSSPNTPVDRGLSAILVHRLQFGQPSLFLLGGIVFIWHFGLRNTHNLVPRHGEQGFLGGLCHEIPVHQLGGAPLHCHISLLNLVSDEEIADGDALGSF